MCYTLFLESYENAPTFASRRIPKKIVRCTSLWIERTLLRYFIIPTPGIKKYTALDIVPVSL